MMTRQEKLKLSMLATELEQAGKEDEAYKVSMSIPLAPHLAMAAKEVYGAEYVKNSGFNLSEAEGTYGKDGLKA